MIRPTIPALVAAALAACAQGVTGSEQTILILSCPNAPIAP